MKIRGVGYLLCSLAAIVARPSVATAQDFDPKPVLKSVIEAFQHCGPPAAYQVLSPNLWSIVWQQTGGTGCYGPIAAAGPVTKLEVIDSKTFPLGPLYVVRVYHGDVPADWFVGFNQATGKIEYLTFQSVAPGLKPTVTQGPDPAKTLGGSGPKPPEPDPKPKPDPKPNLTAIEEACAKFPVMCP